VNLLEILITQAQLFGSRSKVQALGHAPEFFDSQPRVRAPVEDLAELPPMLMPAPVRSHVLASGADVPLHTSHWNAWP
jgi:hypothetical protein